MLANADMISSFMRVHLGSNSHSKQL